MATQDIKTAEQCIPGEGGNLFVRSWRPTGQARGVVVIVPGFNSHSGYYTWTGAGLAARGFSAFSLDLRGRGRSDGERYFIRDIAEYTSDVDVVVRHARSSEPGLPVFLLGHSAGGVVSCTYTLQHQSELQGLICESFAFEVYAPDFALAVLKGLSHIAPHAHVLKLPNKDFSRDASVVQAMDSDPHVMHEVQPTSTVAAMVRADERLRVEFPQMTLPVLIVHGTSDKATKPSGSQFFFDTAGSADKTLKLYEGHYHDLLNDVGKEGVFQDMVDWIDARTEEPAAIALGAGNRHSV
jgi:alpha-beta hydrolase superfamily lysophospholipase